MYEQNNSSSCLAVVVAPLFIVVALIMIAIGWALDNGYLNQTQLTQKLPDAVQTVIVEAERVVVPNGEQQEVVVLPNGDVPQPIAVPNLAVPQPAVAQPALAVFAAVTSQPTPSPTITYPVALTVTATAQPVITVTATAQPAIIVTATAIPATATAAVATATSAAATVTAMNIVTSGHCSTWTVGGCNMTAEELSTPEIYWPTHSPGPSYTPAPTRTPQPTFTRVPDWTPVIIPTVPVVYPTSEPTVTPENNEITTIVTLQGAQNHAGIIVNAYGNGREDLNSDIQMPGEAVTDEMGKFKISGLSRGRYRLTAYTTTGSHIPACLEIDLSGAGSITIPQTMLSNGGLKNADGDNLNLMAAAVFHYHFGLDIPEHLIPILDVSQDGIFDLTDRNMVVANPSLMGCNPW